MSSPTRPASIAVGFDGSAAAHRAVEFAPLDLAGGGGARVFLVYAREGEGRRAEPTTEEESRTLDEAIAAAVAA